MVCRIFPPLRKCNKKPPQGRFRVPDIGYNYSAFWILPERMQRVHTCLLVTLPLSLTRTFFTFGFQIAGVFLLEWLTLLPNCFDLPQMSHFAIDFSGSENIVDIYRIKLFYCNTFFPRKEYDGTEGYKTLRTFYKTLRTF
jgi:hypothetical protein